MKPEDMPCPTQWKVKKKPWILNEWIWTFNRIFIKTPARDLRHHEEHRNNRTKSLTKVQSNRTYERKPFQQRVLQEINIDRNLKGFIFCILNKHLLQRTCTILYRYLASYYSISIYHFYVLFFFGHFVSFTHVLHWVIFNPTFYNHFPDNPLLSNLFPNC